METSTTKITIPKPCHENWNNMTQQEKGRHCASCNKVVVDFTKSSQQEVIDYLQAHKSQKVCGRVNPQVLESTNFNYFHLNKMSRLKIFACALFIVFGTSLFGYGQERQVMGDVMAPEMQQTPPDSVKQTQLKPIETKLGEVQISQVDTIQKANPIFGKMRLQEPIKDTTKIKKEQVAPVKGNMKLQALPTEKDSTLINCTGQKKEDEQQPLMGMIVAPKNRGEINQEE